LHGGVEETAIYAPPTRRTLKFDSGQIEDVPLPAFVFVGRGSEAYLFALKGDVYPTTVSVLYRPPLTNVYSSGHICKGSNVWPVITSGTIYNVWLEFWDSVFTLHLVTQIDDRNPISFWSDLSGADHFPEDVLSPFQKSGQNFTMGKLVAEGVKRV